MLAVAEKRFRLPAVTGIGVSTRISLIHPAELYDALQSRVHTEVVVQVREFLCPLLRAGIFEKKGDEKEIMRNYRLSCRC